MRTSKRTLLHLNKNIHVLLGHNEWLAETSTVQYSFICTARGAQSVAAPPFVCGGDSWQCWSTGLMLSAVTANPACLSKADSHSASLTGMMLHDRAVSTSMWSVPGCYIASKIKLCCFFSPHDSAGGLCRLRLWEQAPCSYSFSSCFHEGWCPAVMFQQHLTKNWKNVFKATTPCWVLVLFCCVCFNLFLILSQCIMRAIHFLNVLWEKRYEGSFSCYFFHKDLGVYLLLLLFLLLLTSKPDPS